MDVEGGGSVLPFVRQFYGTPSTFWWDDDEGLTHDITQGEGGEQGDALMPLPVLPRFAQGSVRRQRPAPSVRTPVGISGRHL